MITLCTSIVALIDTPNANSLSLFDFDPKTQSIHLVDTKEVIPKLSSSILAFFDWFVGHHVPTDTLQAFATHHFALCAMNGRM
jgi:hypothetical protein